MWPFKSTDPLRDAPVLPRIRHLNFSAFLHEQGIEGSDAPVLGNRPPNPTLKPKPQML